MARVGGRTVHSGCSRFTTRNSDPLLSGKFASWLVNALVMSRSNCATTVQLCSAASVLQSKRNMGAHIPGEGVSMMSVIHRSS